MLSAPSNAAVDHLVKSIPDHYNVIRVGNLSKADPAIQHRTIEGQWSASGMDKTIKKLKIRAEEMRKMSRQYKRKFGKSERDQRRLLMQEVKNIRKEIRDLRSTTETQWIEKAQVVVGTPIALNDLTLDYFSFDILMLDEAGQCLEPLYWAIAPLAKKSILAGDPFQLPPTVMSKQAEKMALSCSALERFLN